MLIIIPPWYSANSHARCTGCANRPRLAQRLVAVIHGNNASVSIVLGSRALRAYCGIAAFSIWQIIFLKLNCPETKRWYWVIMSREIADTHLGEGTLSKKLLNLLSIRLRVKNLHPTHVEKTGLWSKFFALSTNPFSYYSESKQAITKLSPL